MLAERSTTLTSNVNVEGHWLPFHLLELAEGCLVPRIRTGGGYWGGRRGEAATRTHRLKPLFLARTTALLLFFCLLVLFDL